MRSTLFAYDAHDVRSVGGVYATRTRREPQRGHFRRLASMSSGNAAPLVHMSV